MITKEEFIQCIDLIKKYSEMSSKLSDILEEMSPGGRCDTFMYSEYEDMTIKLLKSIFNLPKDNDEIEYFIYDLEYGKKYKPGCYTFKNGDEIDFSSAEKLYDFLINHRMRGAANV